MSQNHPPKDFPKNGHNPIDVLEDLAMGQDWPYQRVSWEEIIIDFDGRWSECRFQFFWQKELQIIHMATLIEGPIDPKIKKEMHELIACLNYRLVLGHFEFIAEGQVVAYRLSQYFDPPRMAKVTLLEELIEYALNEIDRFYPAFQFVALGDKTAQDAMSVTLLETMGEA
jgi:hypothetical protein